MAEKPLSKMTKAELEDHAQERFDVDLDKRHTKAALIEEIVALEERGVPDDSPATEILSTVTDEKQIGVPFANDDPPEPDQPVDEKLNVHEDDLLPEAKRHVPYKGKLPLDKLEPVVQIAARLTRQNGEAPSAAVLSAKVGRHGANGGFLVITEADVAWAVAEARRRSKTLDHREIVAKRVAKRVA